MASEASSTIERVRARLPGLWRAAAMVGLSLTATVHCKAKDGELCRCAADCRDGLVCLVGTEVLAQTRGKGGEPGFMAGLLHDVGKPILLGAIMDTEKERLGAKKHIGTEAATQLLDQLHCQVGTLLAKKWRMTADLQRAIGCHQSWSDDLELLTQLVYCGNKIAHHLGLGYKESELVAFDHCGTSVGG